MPRVDPAEEEKKAGWPRFPYRPLQGVCARPGSRKLERLDENIGAVAVKLAADDLQEIESALSQITIQGVLHRLDENIGAVNVELTPDDLHELEEAVAKIQIQGARLPESVLKLTGC